LVPDSENRTVNTVKAPGAQPARPTLAVDAGFLELPN
jgi:hypothetical protein